MGHFGHFVSPSITAGGNIGLVGAEIRYQFRRKVNEAKGPAPDQEGEMAWRKIKMKNHCLSVGFTYLLFSLDEGEDEKFFYFGWSGDFMGFKLHTKENGQERWWKAAKPSIGITGGFTLFTYININNDIMIRPYFQLAMSTTSLQALQDGIIRTLIM